jgi:hypothetical protein
MAIDTPAPVPLFPQPRKRTKAPAKSPAERSKAYRLRQKQKAPDEDKPDLDLIVAPVTPEIPIEAVAPAVITPSPVMPVTASTALKSRNLPDLPRALLALAAFGLAGCGVTMNAMFGHSLGID